jgi:molecular chaperone GrpE (heat shock protein)
MSNLPARIFGVLFLAAAIAAAASAQDSKNSSTSTGGTPRLKSLDKPKAIKRVKDGGGKTATNHATSGPSDIATPIQLPSGDHPEPKPESTPSLENELPQASGPQVSDAGSWATNPLVVAPLALVVLIALGLHFVHISAESKMKQRMSVMERDLRRLSEAMGAPGASVNLAREIDLHGKALASLRSDVDQLNSRAATRAEITQTNDALVLAAEWIGDSLVRSLPARQRPNATEARTGATLSASDYKETLAENANRIKEAAAAIDRLITLLNMRPGSSELAARLQSLNEQILQFKRWEFDANRRLMRGGPSSDDSEFRPHKDRIIAQFKAGEISPCDYLQRYRELIDDHVAGEVVNNQESANGSDQEQHIRDMLAGVTGHLMDWFDRLYQLHNRIQTDFSAGSEIKAEFSRVQKIAKETMARFDIQPEEIEIGRTCFDRRLHDAALVMQASDLPANTIVGVQQCGFRRLSTGAVMRRPKVVVSGNGGAPVQSAS